MIVLSSGWFTMAETDSGRLRESQTMVILKEPGEQEREVQKDNEVRTTGIQYREAIRARAAWPVRFQSGKAYVGGGFMDEPQSVRRPWS